MCKTSIENNVATYVCWDATALWHCNNCDCALLHVCTADYIP